jgi:hypothetical protein
MTLLHGVNWSISTADMKTWVVDRLLQTSCSFILLQIRQLSLLSTVGSTDDIELSYI